MRLQVLATGSAGNCYALHAGGSILLLDAGIKAQQIMREIPNWKGIVGCLITHEHHDHSPGALALAKLGVKVVMSKGTAKAIGADDYLASVYVLAALSTARLGQFTILPFATEHDVAEPFGYIIRYDPTGETVLYATDTGYFRRTFPDINYWIVECNYVDEIVDEQMAEGLLNTDLRNRLKKSHMSLRRLKDVFAANDLSTARKIVLVHLSDDRSHEARMVREVQTETGVDTVAAHNGDVIELELAPF